MNRLLEKLHPYPFERMNQLLKDVQPGIDAPLVSWSIGEPRHPAPDFLLELLMQEDTLRRGLGTYPPTAGLPELRQAIADFVTRRYGLTDPLDASSQVLPVNGTREALFSVAQALLDPQDAGLTLMPNPFYQIYEGAALLAGSQPVYLNCLAENDFLPDLERVDDKTWQDCRLIYICSPGNPTGAVMPREMLAWLIRKSNECGFVIAADECYSEIYQDEASPPPGLLEVASSMGQEDYRNCLAFNSLSKRSNLPGLRSGFVAGDASLLERFLKYRTYHGSAMPVHHQLVSQAAWQDEAHVIANRQLYRDKFNAVTEILSDFWPVTAPAASFYLWPETPVASMTARKASKPTAAAGASSKDNLCHIESGKATFHPVAEQGAASRGKNSRDETGSAASSNGVVIAPGGNRTITRISDTDFTKRLMEAANIKVLPGSFLARDTTSDNSSEKSSSNLGDNLAKNPGANRVRIALVATLDECIAAAERLKANWHKIC